MAMKEKDAGCAFRTAGTCYDLFLAFTAFACFSLKTGCIRVFFLVEPATLVLGRLAESGVAVRALACTVIFFLAGIVCFHRMRTRRCHCFAERRVKKVSAGRQLIRTGKLLKPIPRLT